MKSRSLALLALAAALAAPGMAFAQTQPDEYRRVPPKTLAVPTDVSPEMQALIARPLNPDWSDQWRTGEEARAYADKQAAGVVKTLPDLMSRMHVKMEASTIDGVKVHVIT